MEFKSSDMVKQGDEWVDSCMHNQITQSVLTLDLMDSAGLDQPRTLCALWLNEPDNDASLHTAKRGFGSGMP